MSSYMRMYKSDQLNMYASVYTYIYNIQKEK